MIPIKGYATFHPLKHCWIGSGFDIEWFKDLEIYKNHKIMDPLKRIAEETEEDYKSLETILNQAGIRTYRSFLDIGKIKSLKNILRPPVCPRDHFAVVGDKIYVTHHIKGYNDVLKKIARKDMFINPGFSDISTLSTARICRVGKDIFWDVGSDEIKKFKEKIEMIKTTWQDEGFRVHISSRGYHSDAVFCVVKPGCIVSLNNVQNYAKEFPNWEVLHLPDQSWSKVSPFLKIKEKVGGRWWLNGEENNEQLIHFINSWLTDWVGYVEETVFDVNMLSIDENTIVCNNYNKEVFQFFKKHKVEPIVFNFRHRYFWDGGIHCITQDLYREGEMEDYFG